MYSNALWKPWLNLCVKACINIPTRSTVSTLFIQIHAKVTVFTHLINTLYSTVSTNNLYNSTSINSLFLHIIHHDYNYYYNKYIRAEGMQL